MKTKRNSIGIKASSYGYELSKKESRQITSTEKYLKERQRLTPSQIYSVERFLDKTQILGAYCEKERDRIVHEYQLHRGINSSVYVGDYNAIYGHLVEKYPNLNQEQFHNRDGKGYLRLVYAVLYGSTPCVIIQPANNT